MTVFLTGATGFVGRAVADELLASGYALLGLARSEDAAAGLRALGIEPHRGDLRDADSLRAGVAAADAVIHAGYVHDFSDYAGTAELDRTATEVLGEALAGSGRPFVMTSVTALLEPGRRGTEDDRPAPTSFAVARADAELAALANASRGVRSAVVRLPASVHGQGDQGLVPALAGTALRHGAAGFPGDGTNRWPAVHRLDAARLYRWALEHADPGTVVHAVAEEGVTSRGLAEALARAHSLDVHPIPAEDLVDWFGPLSGFVQIDNPTSSDATRRRTGWTPRQPSLFDDVLAAAAPR